MFKNKEYNGIDVFVIIFLHFITNQREAEPLFSTFKYLKIRDFFMKLANTILLLLYQPHSRHYVRLDIFLL